MESLYNTLSEINSEFTPDNGWLEDFLVSFLGWPIFRGKLAVSFREGKSLRTMGTVDGYS